MDVLGWLLWIVGTGIGFLWSLLWFLIGGWVSTLLQIALLVAIIFYFKYGWQRAPAELWRRAHALVRFVWAWLRTREAPPALTSAAPAWPRAVYAKEFGDINVSTLLSLLVVAGVILLARA